MGDIPSDFAYILTKSEKLNGRIEACSKRETLIASDDTLRLLRNPMEKTEIRERIEQKQCKNLKKIRLF